MKKHISLIALSLLVLGYSFPSFAFNERMSMEDDSLGSDLNERENCINDGLGNLNCGNRGGGGGGGGSSSNNNNNTHMTTKLCIATQQDAGVHGIAACDRLYEPAVPTGCRSITCSSGCWYCSSCVNGYTYNSDNGTCTKDPEPELDFPDCPSGVNHLLFDTNNACMSNCSLALCHICKTTGLHPTTKYYCNDGSSYCRVANCRACTVNNAYECEKCQDGYKVASDGSCVADIPEIEGCAEQESAFSCARCKAGYKRWGTRNKTCSICPEGTYSHEGATECTPCAEGTWSDPDLGPQSQCAPCVDFFATRWGYCTKCGMDSSTNTGRCTAVACERGYIPTEHLECVKPQANCSDPYESSDDGCCCVKKNLRVAE